MINFISILFPMKNNIIFVIILLISACSSLPKVEKSQSLDTLIQKPEFNYKIKSLPKSIKIYFDQRDDESELPQEVQGFIANSFTYSNKISYKPKISFSNFKTEECINDVIKEDLIIEELQRGYHLNGRVLRHALVKVSMGPGPKADNNEISDQSATNEEQNESSDVSTKSEN